MTHTYRTARISLVVVVKPKVSCKQRPNEFPVVLVNMTIRKILHEMLEAEHGGGRIGIHAKVRLRTMTNQLELNMQVADASDVISMSEEGIGSVYVNAHGYVHDMITLRNVQNLGPMGLDGPQTENSWFPGYAWTIMYCNTCRSHLVRSGSNSVDGLSPFCTGHFQLKEHVQGCLLSQKSIFMQLDCSNDCQQMFPSLVRSILLFASVSACGTAVQICHVKHCMRACLLYLTDNALSLQKL